MARFHRSLPLRRGLGFRTSCARLRAASPSSWARQRRRTEAGCQFFVTSAKMKPPMRTCTSRFIRHKNRRRTIDPFREAQFDGERWVSRMLEEEVARRLAMATFETAGGTLFQIEILILTVLFLGFGNTG